MTSVCVEKLGCIIYCIVGFAARMKHINLSFAACGFLGIYHLGAASALCRHGKKLLKDVKAFAGASAGSLVASVLLTAPEKIEECNEFTYKFAEEVRRQSFGAVTPGYDFMARLRGGMESILPHNAHELAHNRLHVSITNTKTRENYLVSSFSSREDLIKVLLASSFVPIYAGLNPVEYRGQKWVDGGLTNSLPILPVGRTVTISPFSGRLDISPQDKGQLDLYVTITNQDIMDLCGTVLDSHEDSKGKNHGAIFSTRCDFHGGTKVSVGHLVTSWPRLHFPWHDSIYFTQSLDEPCSWATFFLQLWQKLKQAHLIIQTCHKPLLLAKTSDMTKPKDRAP
ncbi:patatin-like phospholipase domain-containing protein 4 isoform X2 [Equus asinus]|uniref:patatin-like phospholipase domain-containing protein 4 isoform X2 n=1 Tax=Equus asinus TaxID=9793 RepID=UPI0038F775C5